MEVSESLADDGHISRIAASYDPEPVTWEGIERSGKSELITGVTLREGDVASPANRSLEWLERLPSLTGLGVDLYSRTPTPEIPESVLERLTSLSISGKPKHLVPASSLRKLRLLNMRPLAIISGELRECPELESLHLAGYNGSDLEFVAGCAKLEWLFVEGRRQAIAVRWTEPPRALESLDVHSAALNDLSGVVELDALRHLSVHNGKIIVLDDPLDVSPVRACRALERLALIQMGPVTGLNVLHEVRSGRGPGRALRGRARKGQLRHERPAGRPGERTHIERGRCALAGRPGRGRRPAPPTARCPSGGRRLEADQVFEGEVIWWRRSICTRR